MKLDDLNKLAKEASSHEYDARSLATAATEIGDVRKGVRSLGDALSFLKQYCSQTGPKVKALLAAEALLRDDLLRVAEMDLEAQARALTASARAKRAALATYFCEEAPGKAETAP